MPDKTITKDNFESEVLKSEKPVLIDFWAPWCGPCKMMAPVLEEFASEHPEIKVVKINVDEQSELATQYNIMSIPSLLFLKNGEIINSSIGFVSKEVLEELFL